MEAPSAEHRVARARTAALIAAAGLATYFGYVVITRNVFLFDLGRVAPLFSGLIVANLAFAATAARWASYRRAIYAFEAAQVVACTVILHRLGGLVMGILFVTYAFPIILSEILHSDRSVFFIANVAAVSFAVMLWVEHPVLAALGIDGRQQMAFVAMAFAVLNFLALYADRYGYQLRNLATELQRKVGERTEELTAVNRALGEKARALEEKQEELRSFVYTVTHDLKAPLSAILLTADLVLQRHGGALTAEGRDDLERIVRLAGGTEDMIRDLLEMFRITSRPEPRVAVDLGALVAEAVETLRPQIAAKGARIVVGPLPRVRGEQWKLAHAVSNLLGNAVKYVPAGHGRIEVTSGVDDGFATLSVRDNGIGIPTAYQRNIFDVFGRVPDAEQVVDGAAAAGSGVGLAIVKRVAEAHRGSVAVESAPGRGSCFTLRLPAEERV